MSNRFRVNGPSVTYEAIDGEVVIINLDTGSYYSLTGSGADIWVRLAHGASVSDVADALVRRHEGAPAEIGATLDAFVTGLQTEGLLVVDPGVVAAASSGAPVEDGSARVPFVAPVMQRFTDMQDLLLLDPVHDVTEAGWPHKD